MVTYEQKKQKALHLLRNAISFTKQTKEKDYTKRLQDAEQRLEEGSFIVVVAGEFRRGKSSLLNAFLDIPQGQDLFPVDLSVTTSLASTIKYGKQEQITVLLEDQDSDNVKAVPIKRSEIRQYVTEQGNPQNKREAHLLQIQLPHEQLKLGLMLVDTPGVGGLYAKHTDVTYHFLPNADAVLFVSDVLTPLTETELNFIKEHILPHTEHLFFVLTKMDQIKDYQSMLAENRQKLATTLNRSDDSITIIPISSFLKRRYLANQDTEDLEDSNFPELETILWRFVGAKRGRVLIARALTTLSEVLSEIHRPMQIEYDTYQEQNQQKLDKLEEELKEAKEILSQLQMENAQWQSDLQYGLSAIASEVQYTFEAGFAKIQRKAPSYITEQVLAQPELVLDPVLGEINELLYTIDKMVETNSSQLNETIRQATGLALNKFAPEGLYGRSKPMSAEQLNAVPYRTIEQETFVDTINEGARSSLGPGILGDIAGFVLGVPFLGMIVRGVATLFGANKAQKRKMQQIQRRDRYQVETQLRLEISEQQRDLSHQLNKNIQSLGRSMREDLLLQIKHEKESRERALQSFLTARQRTKAEVATRLTILLGPLQQVKQLLADTEAMLKEVLSKDDDPPIMRSQPPKPGSNQAQNRHEDRGGWADA
jgi:gas vesicle protein/GTPase SAR1 family protein